MTTSMSTSPNTSPSVDYSSLSPTSTSAKGSSSISHRPTKNHLGLPLPPPSDRLPPTKSRSVHIPGQKLKLRKGKDKGKAEAAEEDDWVLEDGNARGSARMDSGEAVITPEMSPLFDSQLTEIPNDRQEKRSKARGLVKKTSRLFSRDREKSEGSNGGMTPDSASSLTLPPNSRQQSYSSATSSGTSSSRHTFAITRPISNTSKRSTSDHSRRLSQDSTNSWQRPPRSIRSESTTTRETLLDQIPPIPHRQSSNLSASVPTLSRQSLPQPGPSHPLPENGNFPSRMSTWFSHLLPSASTNGPVNPSTSPSQDPPSPARKSTSAAASFLNAARQRAVDGVRHLLDSEAQPDKCVDTMWVMGVAHPGWRPSTPSRSPSNVSADLPDITESERRGSGSSDKPSPPSKDAMAVRQAVWRRQKDPIVTASPPSKGFGLFSASTLSLSLPSAIHGSPSKDAPTVTESPGKKKGKVEKEIIKWPDQFYDDFRSRIWCTYRAQYAPILSLPPNLLIPSPEAYYSAFGPPLDASSSQPGPSRPPQPSPSASWGWTGERGLTSDAGWGCMLRTGQSMLANALIHLHLGREWRLPAQKPSLTPHTPSELADLQAYSTYVKLLSWFMDDPSPLCPFSVHRMALIGKELGKEVGEWFGPSTASGALKTLTNSFPVCGLAVATATDSMVYKSDVYAASKLPSKGWIEGRKSTSSRRSGSSTRSGNVWGDKAVLVLVGIRLGLEGVNPIYHESVKALFTFPQSVGIAGGRPSSSYYFVASQASSLFYLDPHLTRPAVPLEIPPASADTTSSGEASSEDTGRASPDTVNIPYTLDVVDVDDLSDSSSNSSPVSSRRTRDTPNRRNIIPPAHTRRIPDTLSTPIAPPLPRNGSDPFRAPSPLPVDPITAWYADAYPDAALRTFHCDKVKKMPLSGLDPSMLLGFLCRDEAEFEDFCARAAKLPQKIFTIQDEPPTWDDDDEAGLESVSEPEMDEYTLDDGDGDEGLVSGDTTVEAIEIPKGQDGEDDEWERRGTPSLVERPFLNGSRGRLDSWIRPGNEGEAPNGKAVV